MNLLREPQTPSPLNKREDSDKAKGVPLKGVGSAKSRKLSATRGSRGLMQANLH